MRTNIGVVLMGSPDILALHPGDEQTVPAAVPTGKRAAQLLIIAA
jgi:hypothetical protein